MGLGGDYGARRGVGRSLLRRDSKDLIQNTRNKWAQQGNTGDGVPPERSGERPNVRNPAPCLKALTTTMKVL